METYLSSNFQTKTNCICELAGADRCRHMMRIPARDQPFEPSRTFKCSEKYNYKGDHAWHTHVRTRTKKLTLTKTDENNCALPHFLKFCSLWSLYDWPSLNSKGISRKLACFPPNDLRSEVEVLDVEAKVEKCKLIQTRSLALTTACKPARKLQIP